MSDEDTCKPGDPDPTPLLPPGEAYCLAPSKEGAGCCTRAQGHRGQHVDGGDGSDRVVAVWP